MVHPLAWRPSPVVSHCGFIEPPSGIVGGLTALACDTATIDRSAELMATWALMTDWLRTHAARGP